jgi:hypothetical protein
VEQELDRLHSLPDHTERFVQSSTALSSLNQAIVSFALNGND